MVGEVFVDKGADSASYLHFALTDQKNGLQLLAVLCVLPTLFLRCVCSVLSLESRQKAGDDAAAFAFFGVDGFLWDDTLPVLVIGYGH